MSNKLDLEWKSFSVDVAKMDASLRDMVGENYDGLVCSPNYASVIFKNDFTNEELTAVQNYWDNVTPEMFAPTAMEIIEVRVSDAQKFGTTLSNQFIQENVALGITQLNLTNHVRKMLREVKDALETGSTYDAISEIKILDPADFDDTIITPERVLAFRNTIEEWLGVPLATNWNDPETWL